MDAYNILESCGTSLNETCSKLNLSSISTDHVSLRNAFTTSNISIGHFYEGGDSHNITIDIIEFTLKPIIELNYFSFPMLIIILAFTIFFFLIMYKNENKIYERSR